MALTKLDWDKHQAAQPVREKPINQSFLQQAAVEAKLLTGHAAWDAYLGKLQVLVDEAQSELNGLHDKLGGPLSEEQLRLAYISVNVFTERLRVLKHCMSLPKELVTHAAELGLVADVH